MPVPIERALQEFLIACRADGLKPATLRWYEGRLIPFSQRFVDKPIDGISVVEAREYVVALRTRGVRYKAAPQRRQIDGPLSADTIRGHIRALRRFFRWCEEEYTLKPTENPMRRIRMPARPKQVPKAIDLVDLHRLFDATGDDLAGIRNKAILAFLADTGCRAGGMLTLTPDRLDLEAGQAIVIEKFDRARAVPFGPFTTAMLRQWLAVRPIEAQTVFCSLTHGAPLKLSGLHSILRRLSARAGVKGRVNPHSFRHGFARQYLANRGDLATLSQLMGHSDVSVTVSYYAVFSQPELAAAHSKFSPLKNWEESLGKERKESDD